MEAEWRSENDPQSLSSSSGLYSLTYSSWLGYGASLVTNIVQNIQVIHKVFIFHFLILAIRELKNLSQKQFALPGEAAFPLGGLFPAPENKVESGN